ncbi:putative signal transduction protein with EFhand domain [Roseobacter sp. SK209-2-6]|uniref:signal transduction protein n=1 Tax=Roseobacter sp. SK209-2-6 TaxID=388739 RepID=UPI0000F3E405|nr:signal transduction protein [Roseobacter sp. SK209-2-6]EBA14447.1 putative signal transduction protein with EFhand domain [Roseobacter sp. SK209-2-6]
MKSLATISILALALSGPELAQSDDMTPGRALAELVYGSMEDDPSGAVDMGEFVNFGRDIFVSMDADESGSIDAQEFTDWDFGFNFIVEDSGQQRAYEAAQKILFAIWDHDADGEIERREYHKSMLWDFRRADVDDDAFLTQDEFLRGYVVNVAYRAAITGQLSSLLRK